MDENTAQIVVSPENFENLPLLIACIPILIALRAGLTLIYNFLFHPLRKYPGPKLAAATDLVYAYHRVNGTEADWARRIHEEYGDVVRLGPKRLSYTKPEAWRDITCHHTGGHQENGKYPLFYTPEMNGEHSMISIRDPQEHGQIRKIFSHAFSARALKLQEGLIRGYVQNLAGNMKRTVVESPSARMNAVKLYNCTTFDIMGDLTFGQSLGMLESSEYSPWVKAVFDNIKISAIVRPIEEVYPSIGRLMPRYLQELRKSHFDHTVQRVNHRLEVDGNSHKPDFWSLVLKDGQELLTLPQMYANASLFMIAGTETTASLLSGLTYLLLKNPDKMEKVVDEIRSLALEDLSLENLQRLPFLNACLEEGLRCYPPVPIGLPRETPKGGNAICGEWIPEKILVFVPFKAAFDSERNFKDATSFVPERWLPGTGYENDRKDVFQPFSFGHATA